MKDTQPVVIRREEYRPPPYTIDSVELDFELGEELTRVTAVSQVRRTADGAQDAPLVLDGQGLMLESIAIDGLKVVVDDYVHDVGNNAFLNGLILFAGIGAGALALFSLAKVALGAAA